MLDALFSDENKRDLLISAKIFASIMWGVACGFISYGLFHAIPVTIVSSPLMGAMLVGAFFGPQEHRKDFAVSIAAVFFCALIVAGMMRVESSTYTSIFNFLYGLFCFACIVGLVVFFCWACVAINDQSTASNGTNTNEATAEFLRRQRANGDTASIDPATTIAVPTPEVEKTPERPERRRWSIETRRQLWIQHGKKCFYCNLVLVSWRGEHMHLDHVDPVSRGGPDTESNLRPACPDCNLEKSAKHFPEILPSSTRRKSNT
jgi:hypothetical protein